MDADYVFDVRMLPNPHYESELRNLTGRDIPVASFLQNLPEVQDMQADISKFVSKWLAALARDHRSYVTIAIGCTGGQHRSVYLVEQLAAAFAHEASRQFVTLKRHRELQN
jgi:RNase adapter protein RapZ